MVLRFCYRMAKPKGRKGKKTKSGSSAGGSQAGSVESPADVFATLQQASPEELNDYMQELYMICEETNVDQSNIMTLRSQVRDPNVNYNPGSSQQVQSDDSHDEFYNEQVFNGDYQNKVLNNDFYENMFPSDANANGNTQGGYNYNDVGSWGMPPPLPPRAHVAPPLPPRQRVQLPPPLPPKKPLVVTPLYDFDANVSYSFENVLPRGRQLNSPYQQRDRSRSPVRYDRHMYNTSSTGDYSANSRYHDRYGRPIIINPDVNAGGYSRQPRQYQLRDGQADDPMAFNPSHLSGAIKDMLGIGPASQGGDFMNSYLLLGTNLDPKLKAKIIAGEYVEKSALWDQDEAPAKVNMSLSQDEETQMSFTAAKPRDPATLSEWSYLFFVYASVYGSYRPDEASGMFMYMRRIADLHRDYPSTYIWRIYDVKFRKAKAACQLIPWHVTINQMQSDARSAYYRSLTLQNQKRKG